MFRLAILMILIASLSSCDSGASDSSCEPAAAVSPTYPENASVTVADAAGCRVETAGAFAGPADYLFGLERDYERYRSFLFEILGPINDGASVRLGFAGENAPVPGRYPVTDLRGGDGRFGQQPARFEPGAFFSFTTNGDGQGYWFATGGEVIVESSDESGVAGTFEATYLYGGGGRPITLRGRFRAVPGVPDFGLFLNPHGG